MLDYNYYMLCYYVVYGTARAPAGRTEIEYIGNSADARVWYNCSWTHSKRNLTQNGFTNPAPGGRQPITRNEYQQLEYNAIRSLRNEIALAANEPFIVIPDPGPIVGGALSAAQAALCEDIGANFPVVPIAGLP